MGAQEFCAPKEQIKEIEEENVRYITKGEKFGGLLSKAKDLPPPKKLQNLQSKERKKRKKRENKKVKKEKKQRKERERGVIALSPFLNIYSRIK